MNLWLWRYFLLVLLGSALGGCPVEPPPPEKPPAAKEDAGTPQDPPQVEDAGTPQVPPQVQDAGSEPIEVVTDAGNDPVEVVEDAGNGPVVVVADAGSDPVEEVEDAGTAPSQSALDAGPVTPVEDAGTASAETDAGVVCETCMAGSFLNVTHCTCTPFTECTSGEYEFTPPSATTDRVCEPLTECTSGEYELSAPTYFADRVCEPLTECTSGEYESDAATPTSDRICSPLTDCVPGEFVEIEPAWDSDRICSSCTLELDYSTEVNAPSCTHVNPACDVSTHYESSAPTLTSDRICSVLYVCADDEWEVTPPNYTSDRVCTIISSCAPNEYESVPATPTSDRVCSPVNDCDDGEEELEPPTETSDRVCGDIDECQTDNGGCHLTRATCTNAENSGEAPLCDCNDGFEGGGVLCEDVDECETNNGGCDPNASCENAVTPGDAPICTCPPELEGDGSFCIAKVGSLSVLGPDVVIPGACVPLTANALLHEGEAWPDVDVTVNFSIPQGTLYDDDSCANELTAPLNLSENDLEVTVYWKAEAALDWAVINASAIAFDDADLEVIVHDDNYSNDSRADKTLIIYNTNDPDAFGIADYYRVARNINADRLCGVEFPRGQFASRHQLLEARNQVVSNCFCALTTESIDACDQSKLDEILPVLPITHLALIRGIPPRLFSTGWSSDFEEPAFDYYFSYLLAGDEDIFCDACSGYVTIDYDASQGISPKDAHYFALGRVEAITPERTLNLIDRTLQSESFGFTGNFISEEQLWNGDVQSTRSRRLGYFLTSSFDPVCSAYLSHEPFVWEAPESSWPHELCRWGSTGSTAAGSVPGMMPGYENTTIPYAMNAGWFNGTNPRIESPQNNMSAFNNYDTMLRWRKESTTCVPECEDLPTTEEQEACVANSTDYFQVLNTDCVGVAPGFMGQQVRSYPVQYYGFYPDGWHPWGAGRDDRTPPRVLTEGTDLEENRFLRFGFASPEALNEDTCGAINCKEWVAVNVRRWHTLDSSVSLNSDNNTIAIALRYRNQGNTNARFDITTKINDVSLIATATQTSAATVSLSENHLTWADHTVEFSLPEGFSDSTIDKVEIKFDGRKSKGILGFVDLDSVTMTYAGQNLLGDAFSEFDNVAPRHTAHGGSAADVIDRMGGIAYWGSSSHHLTNGHAYDKSFFVAKRVFEGRTLGESLSFTKAQSGIAYGDPLYRGYGVRIYSNSSIALKNSDEIGAHPSALDTLLGDGMSAWANNSLLQELHLDILNGTSNVFNLQWRFSACSESEVELCDEEDWVDLLIGQGAIRGFPIQISDLYSRLGQGSQTLRLRSWVPSRAEEHLSAYVRLSFEDNFVDPEVCIGDVDGNGRVEHADRDLVQANRTCTSAKLVYDINQDGAVNHDDLITEQPEECIYDLDGDSVVLDLDRSLMLLKRVCTPEMLESTDAEGVIYDNDLDDDLDVDVDDWYQAPDAVSQGQIFENLCSSIYDASYDFNDDQTIDDADVDILAANIGFNLCFCSGDYDVNCIHSALIQQNEDVESNLCVNDLTSDYDLDDDGDVDLDDIIMVTVPSAVNCSCDAALEVTDCLSGIVVITEETCDPCATDSSFLSDEDQCTCSPFTECTLAEYELAAPSATTDRICVPLTECAVYEYESVPPTVISDRECAPVSVWVEAEDYGGVGLDGLSYHDASPGNDYGAYRDDDVDIYQAEDGSFVVDMQAGEFMFYSVDLPFSGPFDIRIHAWAADLGRELNLYYATGDTFQEIALRMPVPTDGSPMVVKQVDLPAGPLFVQILNGVYDGVQLDAFEVTVPQCAADHDGDSYCDGEGETEDCKPDDGTCSTGLCCHPLVGHWQFDENEGVTAADSSGNEGQATVYGSANWVTGKTGGALSLDGDTYVEVTHAEQFEVGDTFSFTAWIKLDAAAGRVIEQKHTNARLTFDGGKYNLRAAYTGSSLWAQYDLQSSSAASLDTWEHVAFVISGMHLRLYINGALDKTEKTEHPYTSMQNYTGILMGSGMEGAIDDVRLYDGVLSDEDVAMLYAMTPDLVTGCSDGIDNDNDGKVDFEGDPGCMSPFDNDETYDLASPLTPQNIHVVEAAATIVHLAWDPLDDAELAGYNIYRDGRRIDTVLRPAFYDVNVEMGVDYEYEVRSMGANGLESTSSSLVSVSVPLRDARTPAETIFVSPEDFQGYGSLKSIIENSPEDTTFVLRPGVYRLTSEIRPRTGQSIFGQQGAVLSGAILLNENEWETETFNGDILYVWPDLLIYDQTHQEPGSCADGGYGCLYRQDLFFNDQVLERVMNKEDLAPGKFYTHHDKYKTRCVRSGDHSGTETETIYVDATSGTSLGWQGCPAGQSGSECEQGNPHGKTWEEAVAFCDGLSWAGLSDWRLPTIDELRSLVRGCTGTQTGGDCVITHQCSFEMDNDCGASTCSASCSGTGAGEEGQYWPSDLKGRGQRFWSVSEKATHNDADTETAHAYSLLYNHNSQAYISAVSKRTASSGNTSIYFMDDPSQQKVELSMVTNAIRGGPSNTCYTAKVSNPDSNENTISCETDEDCTVSAGDHCMADSADPLVKTCRTDTCYNHVTIKGLIIEKFATVAQRGAINPRYSNHTGDTGRHWIVEQNEVRWNHGLGIRTGAHSILKNNQIHNNGNSGAETGSYTWAVGNEFSEHNWAKYMKEWSAGAFKIVGNHYTVIKGNYAGNNNGHGMWTDIYNRHVVYEDNVSVNNNGDGFKHEISYDCAIRRNTGLDNYHRDNGNSWRWGSLILVQNSENCDVYDNYVEVGPIGNGINIIDQTFRNNPTPLASETDEDVSRFYGRHNAIHRNRIIYPYFSEEVTSANDDSVDILVSSQGYSGYERQWDNIVDYNSYVSPDVYTKHFGNTWSQFRSFGNESHGQMVQMSMEPSLVFEAPMVSWASPLAGENLNCFPYPQLQVEATAAHLDFITKVEFFVNGMKLAQSSGAPYAVDWYYPEPDTYEVKAVVHTMRGLMAETEPVSLTVSGACQ